jgi:hypothetical protein
MAKRKYTKSNEEIVSLVSSKVGNCSTWYDSKLSRERELVQQYYNGTKPARQHQGSSTYISSDVYDAVEMMKSQLLETFATGHEIVKFTPVGPEDVIDAAIATAYTSHMVFDRNDGFGTMSDVIHDGLTARVGVVKYYWETYYNEWEEEFEGLPYQEVEALAADPEVDELDGELEDEEAGTFKGTLKRKRDCSKVCIDVLPPEEFLIEERANSIFEAKVCDHRTLKTRSELLKLGYPKSKVDRVQFDSESSLELSPDYQARRAAVDGNSQLGSDAVQKELQLCILHETYMEMALEKDGVARLYRVVWSDTVMFECQQVERKPFLAFCPLPIPHMFYGNNYAHRVVPHQTARTALTRSVLDHAAITNNPRLQVLKGGLLNPRELLDNRLGGLVNVNRPDAITPMQQTPLNPFVFEIISMVKENREETTGITSLSQGLNKDAISKQNSEALIDKMVTVSQQRQKIIARNFGKFLKELWLEVYRLVIENEDKQKVFEYSGNHIKINPSAWVERKDVQVSLHLGYGEQDKEADKLVKAYAAIAQDPGLAPMFTIEKRHKLATDALVKQGIKNFDDYLERPEKAQPQQPDPLAVKELEIKDKQAQAALMNAQTGLLQAQTEAQEKAAKIAIEQAKVAATVDKNERDAVRQDADVANRIDVSQREMELAEKVPPEGQRGIFSPNS